MLVLLESQYPQLSFFKSNALIDVQLCRSASGRPLSELHLCHHTAVIIETLVAA